MATFYVNTAADSSNGNPTATTGSFRDAIIYANANPGTTITFGITNTTITLTSALPAVANATVIDGGINNITVTGQGLTDTNSLTLERAMTYTASTALNAGTLIVNGTTTIGNVRAAGGTTLEVGSGGTLTQTVGTVVNTNSGTLTVVNQGTISNTGDGANTFNGAATLNVLNSGTISTVGSYALVSNGSGAIVTNAANGTLAATGSNGHGVQLYANATINNYGIISGSANSLDAENANATVNLFAGSTTGKVGLLGGTSTLSLYTGTGTSAAGATDAASGITLQAAGTNAAASVGAIAFGGSGNMLVLTGSGDGTGPNGAAGALSLATVTGANTIAKTGTGTFQLTGSAAGTGNTIINAGTGSAAGLLQFNGSTGLTSTINVNGAKIQALTAGAFGTGTINAIDPTIEYSATGAYANPIVLDSASTGDPTKLEADSGVTATLSGGITQSTANSGLAMQPLVVDGAGTIILSAPSTYTGPTTVSNGTLRGGATNAFASGSRFTVNSTLDLGGFNQAIGLLAGSGIVTDTGSAATLTTGGLNASSTFSGTIQDGTGVTSLTTVGTGTLTLSGTDTYTGGTTFAGGELDAGSTGALGSTGTLSFTGGTLKYSAANQTDYSSRFSTAAGQATSIDTNGQAVTFASGLTSSGGTLTKVGTGTLTLSGADTFTGGTNINAGTLALSSTSALAATGAVTLANTAGATLAVNASNTIGSLNGGGTTGGAVTIASGDTLTIGGDNTSTTYAGSVSGAGLLTKSGTGTLTLSGASTNAADYASAGTLTLATGSTLTTAGGVIPGSSTHAAAGVGVGATLVNAGVITATGGSEDGVDVVGGTFLNSGTLQGATFQGVNVTGGGTVTNTGTGSISGGNGVLSIDAGALTVTGGGSITGTLGDGIDATRVGANNIVLGTTASGAALGAVTGAAEGIEATTSGAGTIGLVTGANVTGSNGAGITTATSGSGATSISAGGGTIKGTTIGLGATTSGSGTVSVTTLAGETVQSGSGSAIVVTATSASSGAVTVMNAATLSHASGTGSDGIDAETSGTGGIVVTNSGAIGATGGTFATGILAGATTAASDVTVSNTAGGTIGAAGNAVTGTGIHAYASGSGRASVDVINGAAITATAFGIQASDAGHGNVNVYGGGAINAGTTGISAVETGSGSANVGVNYSTLGAITAAADGIDVSTALGGSVTVYAGVVTSTAGSGIVASVSGGTGTIAVTIGGNVSGAQDGLSVASGSLNNTVANAFNVAGAIGLEVNGGTTTLTNTGTITGTTNAIKIDAGTLAIGNSAGTITGAIADAGTLAFSNTTAIALASAITGAGSLTQTGSGTTTLSGADTYTGATTVSAGTLKAGSTSAFAGGSAFTVSNATLDLGGFSQTIGSLSGSFSTVTNSGTAAVTLTTGGTGGSSFSGTIQDGANGTVALTKVGTGNFTLNAASTYSGGTTISAGQLSATNVGAFGTGAIVDNASLLFNTPTGTVANAVSGSGTLFVQNQSVGNTTTFSGALTGGLGLNVANGGTVVLTSTGNTRTGATTIGANTTLQGTTATLSGGAITDNGTLAFNQTGAGSFASAISGSGAVTVGGGTVTLTGASTYTGGTTISAGALVGGATNAFSAGSAVTDSATLDLGGYSEAIGSLSGAGTVTDTGATATLTVGGRNTSSIFSGAIQNGAGTTALTKVGTGTLTLSGTNTYTGGTMINAGTLALSSTTSLAATGGVTLANTAGAMLVVNVSNTIGSLAGGGTTGGTVTIASGDTLTTGGANTSTTYAGVIAGAGSLTKSGTGTLTLSGANTYSGGTTLAVGTLELASVSAAGTGGVVFSGSAATLQLDAAALASGGTSALAISGFTMGDTLDLRGLAFQADDVAFLSGNTLTVGDATASETLTSFADASGQTGYFAVSSDGHGGTNVVLTQPVAPTISGTHTNTTISDAAVTPFSGVTIGDTNGGATDTLTITVGGTGGTLTGAGSLAGGVYTLTGTAAQVTTQLDAVSFIPTAGQPNTTSPSTFALSDTSVAFATPTTDSTTTVTDTDPAVTPTIGGPYATTVVAGATVTATAGTNGTGALAGDSDPNSGGTLSVTSVTSGAATEAITAGGSATIAGTYGTLTQNADGSYSYADTNGLAIASAPPGQVLTDSFTETVTSSAGPSSSTTLSFTTSAAPGGSETITDLSGSATLTIGGKTLTLANDAPSTFDGIIQDGSGNPSGAVVVTGPDTLTLTGASTYTGGTTISGGTLEVTQGTATGQTSSSVGGGALNFDGGTLQLDGIALANAVTIDGNGGTIGVDGASTLSGDISTAAGMGGLTVQDPTQSNSVLTLTGQDAVAGGLTIGAGTTVQIGDGTTTGSLTGDVVDNGTLAFDPGASGGTYAGAVSGAGVVLKTGAGTTTLSGASTNAADYVSAGTLMLATGATLTTAGGQIPGGSLMAAAGVAAGAILNNAGTITANGNEDGVDVLGGTFVNSGTLTGAAYQGVYVAGGATIVNTGSISGGNGILPFSGALTVTGGGSITGTVGSGIDATRLGTNNVVLGTTAAALGAVTGADSGIVASTSGAGTIGVVTAGAVTGSNGYGIEANADGSGTVSVAVSGDVTGTTDGIYVAGTTASNSVTVGAGATVKGAVGLEVAGGTTTLSNSGTIASTHNNNAIQIDSGTLAIGNNAGTITGAIADGGALNFTNTSAITIASAIIGAGTLTQSGSGTTTLSGANTYSGGTTLAAGTLELASVSAAGTGGVAFSGSAATLQLDAAALASGGTSALAIRGFTMGDTLDLRGLAFQADDVAVLSGGTLTIGDATASDTLTSFADASGQTGYFAVSSDGHGGTNVVLTQPVAPTISGTHTNTTISDAAITLFSGVTIGDTNGGATDTLTITVGGTGGTLTGAGSLAGGVYTLTGTAAQVTTQLDAVSFIPTAGQPNTTSPSTFALSDTSVAFATPTTDSTTTVTDTDPAVAPTIAVTTASFTTTSEQAVNPFTGVMVSDTNNSGADQDTLTITQTGAGTLSGTRLVATGTAGVYTITDTAANIDADLATVSFTPVDGVPNSAVQTSFALSDRSSVSTTAGTAGPITVTDTDPAVAPTIGGTHASTTTSEAAVTPFSGVTISDANGGATDTLTITVGGSGGTLTGAGPLANGVYTLTGTAAQVTTQLDALSFTPTAGAPNTTSTSTFTLSDTSSAFATPATDSATAVVDTDPASTSNQGLFGSLTHDVTSPGGNIYALYEAIFGRAPDPTGFENAVAEVQAGVPLTAIAQGLLSSPEYTADYGSVSQSSDQAFVSQLYKNGLGRAPEPSGLQYWHNALSSNTLTRAQVAVDIATSSEAQGDLAATFQAGVFVPSATDSAIARLYYGVLDRAPDAAGLQTWEGVVASGTSITQVARDFLASPEYETTAVGQSNMQFIQGLYQSALGRVGEAAGVQTWETALDSGALDRAGVVAGFLGSTEFQADTAADGTDAYINQVYAVALGRQAEPAGLQTWESAFAHGLSRTAFDQDVVASAEFQANITSPAQTAFVNALYEGALGRPAEAGGLQVQLGALAGGTSLASLTVGIAESPEAQTHLAPRIEAGFHVA